MLDVAIVGAGPAGLELANELDKLNVVVIEENKTIGLPNHCSGLISRNIDSISKPDPDCIEHRVKGAVFHSPGGKSFVLKKSGFAAYVIDRQRFDASLAERLNCDLLMGSRLTSFTSTDSEIQLKVNGKQMKARCLVGADGSGSFVGRYMGAVPKEKIPGIIAITNEKDDSEFVDLWFDKKLTDCFIWKIPRGEKTEYGMWGRGSRFDVLDKFFDIKKGYVKQTGVIPLGPPKTYFDKTILVGDAAAQVKPWSGGGVVYGMTCARIAADVLSRAPDFSENSLREYERRWKKAIGKQLAAGMFMRRLYARSSNSQVDRLMATAKYLRLLNRLDMDFLVKK